MPGIVPDLAPAPKVPRSHRFVTPSLATLGRTLLGKVGRPDNLFNRRNRYNRTGDLDSIPRPPARLSGRQNSAVWTVHPQWVCFFVARRVSEGFRAPCRSRCPRNSRRFPRSRGGISRQRVLPTDRRKSARVSSDESHSTPRGSDRENHTRVQRLFRMFRHKCEVGLRTDDRFGRKRLRPTRVAEIVRFPPNLNPSFPADVFTGRGCRQQPAPARCPSPIARLTAQDSLATRLDESVSLHGCFTRRLNGPTPRQTGSRL
jgi:hypothetical protein